MEIITRKRRKEYEVLFRFESMVSIREERLVNTNIDIFEID